MYDGDAAGAGSPAVVHHRAIFLIRIHAKHCGMLKHQELQTSRMLLLSLAGTP
jgi:hypothetical protein